MIERMEGKLVAEVARLPTSLRGRLLNEVKDQAERDNQRGRSKNSGKDGRKRITPILGLQ